MNGCWELNFGPLQEPYILLTMEPPVQPPGNLKAFEEQGEIQEPLCIYKAAGLGFQLSVDLP